MAKGFKTGGRTAGTLNKRTQAMLEEIASTGDTPLQYMLRVMRDPEAAVARRDAMAAAAAPYIHPRMAQVDMHAQYDVPIKGVRFWTRLRSQLTMWLRIMSLAPPTAIAIQRGVEPTCAS